MPNIANGILKFPENYPNKSENQYPNEIFYKIIERTNEEDTNYKKISDERNNVLSKILDLHILKYENKNEGLKEEYLKLRADINSEQDLFYRILKQKDHNLWKEIYENINIEKEYSIEEIKSSLDRVNKEIEGEKKYDEQLLKAYYTKLWCFNFITFNYIQNDELIDLLISQNKINLTKDGNEKNLPNEEYKTLLKNKYKIIYLEKGQSLRELIKLIQLKIKDKSKSQLLIQKIMKQILIGLYLIHHLSKEQCLYHNDLKPDNILICFNEKNDNEEINTEEQFINKYMNATYKLVDLDLTRQIKYFEIQEEYRNRMYKNNIFPYDDPDKEEIYEVGEILWELLTGEMHYLDDKKNFDYKKMYLKKNCIIKESEKLCLPTVKFLHSCLQNDRRYRITCDDALEHEFIIKEKNFNQPINFKDLPKDMVSQDEKFFYLPIYRPTLGLNKYSMSEDEETNVEF